MSVTIDVCPQLVDVTLATAHDPTGAYLTGLGPSVTTLRTLFEGCAVVVTEPTSDDVVAFLTHELGADVIQRPADGNVGRHRRAALQLAQNFDPPATLYADLDHVLRWISADTAELASVLDGNHPDLLVIGRSAQAMAARPARLRDTESIVNHIYGLVGLFSDCASGTTECSDHRCECCGEVLLVGLRQVGDGYGNGAACAARDVTRYGRSFGRERHEYCSAVSAVGSALDEVVRFEFVSDRGGGSREDVELGCELVDA